MSKILIVEDDISLRDVYSARLEGENYQIVVAANGEEALATAVKERPDLILLDVMMPKISGFDVLDIIRTTPEIAHTRVIMMTALSAAEDRERGEKLGVDKYLVKSQVTLEEVVGTIKTVLGAAPAVDKIKEDLVGASGNQRASVAPVEAQQVPAPVVEPPLQAEAPPAQSIPPAIPPTEADSSINQAPLA
ncbi:response regulator [Candidatus Saccharibacteria bacterium]|nr:response regulator [Candidatus Saccharibacteria bacterium]